MQGPGWAVRRARRSAEGKCADSWETAGIGDWSAGSPCYRDGLRATSTPTTAAPSLASDRDGGLEPHRLPRGKIRRHESDPGEQRDSCDVRHWIRDTRLEQEPTDEPRTCPGTDTPERHPHTDHHQRLA